MQDYLDQPVPRLPGGAAGLAPQFAGLAARLLPPPHQPGGEAGPRLLGRQGAQEELHAGAGSQHSHARGGGFCPKGGAAALHSWSSETVLWIQIH